MSHALPLAAEKRSIDEEIAALGPWLQNLRLRGVQTAPDLAVGDHPERKFASFRHIIPTDLRGKTVLDIDCNAGFYSLEMKRRGASRVLGIDGDEHYLRQARFAALIERADIEFRRMAVWDVAELGEKFDWVVFMEGPYHLRHPLLALDLIHEHVAKDWLLFQGMGRGSREIAYMAPHGGFNTQDSLSSSGYPKMHFIEHRYAHDETNWWIPNRPCVDAMLRSSGFSIEGQYEDEVYLCRRQSIDAPPDGPHCVYPGRGPCAR